MDVLSLAVGLVPMLLFLAGLQFMDSFKLVSRRFLLVALLAGAAAAGIALLINLAVLQALHVDALVHRRYIAPLVEELLKALYVVWLLRAHRVGFMVDAGILGFAVGTGFALVENMYYAWAGSSGLGVWLVRGLGTAMMHGATTAIVAILAKVSTDRAQSTALRRFLPGLALAFAIHSLFNHLLLNSFLTTALMLLVMPLVMFVVFERSEQVTRTWLGTTMDDDVERLEQILGGEIATTRIGAYLESLKSRFPGAVVADMLCLLRIHLELALRAKGMLIARRAGLEVPPDEHVRANFDEMRYLEKSIGPTGRIALLPFLKTSDRELWQLYMLDR
jgi:RsiW-degrading membrane proteinase PrsW (M82 family)